MKVLREKDRLWSLDVSDPRVLHGHHHLDRPIDGGYGAAQCWGQKQHTPTRPCRRYFM